MFGTVKNPEIQSALDKVFTICILFTIIIGVLAFVLSNEMIKFHMEGLDQSVMLKNLQFQISEQSDLIEELDARVLWNEEERLKIGERLYALENQEACPVCAACTPTFIEKTVERMVEVTVPMTVTTEWEQFTGLLGVYSNTNPVLLVVGRPSGAVDLFLWEGENTLFDDLATGGLSEEYQKAIDATGISDRDIRLRDPNDPATMIVLQELGFDLRRVPYLNSK